VNTHHFRGENVMSLKQNDEYYEQQREMQEEKWWSVLLEAVKLLILMGLWYLGFLALYAFSG